VRGTNILRPSRQPLRGFLRMRFFLNAIKEPAQARSAAAKGEAGRVWGEKL
jgi:hypothetical protein